MYTVTKTNALNASTLQTVSHHRKLSAAIDAAARKLRACEPGSPLRYEVTGCGSAGVAESRSGQVVFLAP